MKNQFDTIIANAPAWIIGVSSKVTPGERTRTNVDIDGRSITPDELAELIEASDQVKGEDITINVIEK